MQLVDPASAPGHIEKRGIHTLPLCATPCPTVLVRGVLSTIVMLRYAVLQGAIYLLIDGVVADAAPLIGKTAEAPARR